MPYRRFRYFAIVCALACFGWSGFAWSQSKFTQSDQAASDAIVHLYFISGDGRHLKAETMSAVGDQTSTQRGRNIMEALCKGPRSALAPLFSAPVEVRSFFIDDEGIAYVDFPAALRRAQPGGITHEQLTVYAIVNALILNVPQISAVKFLIDGQEAETFAGHIDIEQPLTANLMLIR